MKKSFLMMAFLAFALSACFYEKADAQEYVSPLAPTLTGRSPGVKVKLIGEDSLTKNYVLVFAPGDEIMSGLKEFAIKYHVNGAHFTAIGDATFIKFGWFDEAKKMFKLHQLKESLEITSLIGDIALNSDNGTPIVHAHINVATQDGLVHGSHLLEAFVSPTLEVFVTVEPTSLYKKLTPEFNLFIMDPNLKK